MGMSGVVFLIVIILTSSVTFGSAAPSSIPVSAVLGDQVVVCCAWNDKLADGVLTYKVSGGTEDVKDAIIEAIEEWDTEIVGLELILNEAKGKAGKSDITVKYKEGGGFIAGETLHNFDKGSSFVNSVQINVTGKVFGNTDLAPIIKLVKHEFGHALGLNHANFNGDLMSTTVGVGALNISSCDVDGVIAANHWKLVDGSATPHTPLVNYVYC